MQYTVNNLNFDVKLIKSKHNKARTQTSFFFKPSPKLLKETVLGRFPKVGTGRPDHGWTGDFKNKKGFFQEFLTKSDFLRVYYLWFDWSGWIALIKSKIFITTGMSWPVSSDKWKAPLDCDLHFSWHLVRRHWRKARNMPFTKVGHVINFL